MSKYENKKSHSTIFAKKGLLVTKTNMDVIKRLWTLNMLLWNWISPFVEIWGSSRRKSSHPTDVISSFSRDLRFFFARRAMCSAQLVRVNFCVKNLNRMSRWVKHFLPSLFSSMSFPYDIFHNTHVESSLAHCSWSRFSSWYPRAEIQVIALFLAEQKN